MAPKVFVPRTLIAAASFSSYGPEGKRGDYDQSRKSRQHIPRDADKMSNKDNFDIQYF